MALFFEVHVAGRAVVFNHDAVHLIEPCDGGSLIYTAYGTYEVKASVERLIAALEYSGSELSMRVMDGDGVKVPQPGEGAERLQRTDPSDGLRPTLEARAGGS